jgi:hypothetical protein
MGKEFDTLLFASLTFKCLIFKYLLSLLKFTTMLRLIHIQKQCSSQPYWLGSLSVDFSYISGY